MIHWQFVVSNSSCDALEVGAVATGSFGVGREAETSLTTRIAQVARLRRKVRHSDAVGHRHPLRVTAAVAEDDVPHRAPEPVLEQDGRQRQELEPLVELGRETADVDVTVAALAEVKVRPEGEAAVGRSVDGEDRLHTTATDDDLVPASVVDSVSHGDLDLALSLVDDVHDQTDPTAGHHDLEEVAAAAVVDVPQQAFLLGRLELERERVVGTSDPGRIAGVGRVAALDGYGRRHGNAEQQRCQDNAVPVNGGHFFVVVVLAMKADYLEDFI